MQIDFYLLAKTQPADRHHYACRLAAHAHRQGMTVFIQTEDPAHSALLDAMLWTFAQDSFVPHAVCAHDAHDAHDVVRYPVQLGPAAAPPECTGLLIALAHEPAADYARFQRIAEVVPGDDPGKAAARERFRFYRAQGIEPRAHHIT